MITFQIERGRPARQRKARPVRMIQFEPLESRDLMATAYEAYGWYVINQMRRNPRQFADELVALYNNRGGGHGYAANDPVWVDLRDTINRGKYKQHFQQAVDLLRQQSPLGPLALDDNLTKVANEHNTWMRRFGYLHSQYEGKGSPGTPQALPGLSQENLAGRFDVINKRRLGGTFSDGSWAENIGSSSGNSLSATRARFGVGTPAHRQRQAYSDVIRFIVEVNSDSLGHLRNLLSRDRADYGQGAQSAAKNKEIGRKNAIGLGYFARDNFANDQTNWLATHTLSFLGGGTNNRRGGFISGVAYSDKNGNDRYDIGEGLRGGWEYSYTEGMLGLGGGIAMNFDNFGVFNEYLDTASVVTFKYFSGGRTIASRQVKLTGQNVWLELQVSPGFGLTEDNDTPRMASDVFEAGSGNNTQANATNLGTIRPGRPFERTTTGLSIHAPGDVDWFRFDVGQATARSQIEIGFDHAKGNINASLYRVNANGTVSSIGTSNGVTDRESFDRPLRPGGYLLKVEAAGNNTNFYSLNIDLRSSSVVGDYDGDGKADPAVYGYGRLAYRPSAGGADVYIPFGGTADAALVGDYDGDGEADLAVYGYGRLAYRPSSGGDDVYVPFGGPADLPLAGDYDGDGKADAAVHGYGRLAYRPSSGGPDVYIPFGGPADLPLAGDYDGDGKADPAVYGYGRLAYRPSSGGADVYVPFGGTADAALAGDYDGDGRADLAVYGYGRLAYRPSSGGADVYIPFGGPADEALVVDYDGDGKADAAVHGYGRLAYRPSSGGADVYVPFGGPADGAIPRRVRFT